MLIRLDDRIVAIWYVALPGGDYLAGLSRSEDGGGELVYRFCRPSVEDGWPVKEWDSVRHADLQMLMTNASNATNAMVATTAGRRWEQVRGDASLEDFVKELRRLPFWLLVSESTIIGMDAEVDGPGLH